MFLVFASLLLLAIALTLGSPILALGLGAAFSIFSGIDDRFYTRIFATRLLQIGIILIGLSIDAVDVFELTKAFFPVLALFVSLAFFFGLIDRSNFSGGQQIFIAHSIRNSYLWRNSNGSNCSYYKIETK